MPSKKKIDASKNLDQSSASKVIPAPSTEGHVTMKTYIPHIAAFLADTVKLMREAKAEEAKEVEEVEETEEAEEMKTDCKVLVKGLNIETFHQRLHDQLALRLPSEEFELTITMSDKAGVQTVATLTITP